jgi:hypothetical protein
MTDLRNELAQLQARSNLATAVLSQSVAEIKELQRALETTRAELGTAQTELATTRAELEAAQTELATTRAEMKTVRTAYDAILNSTSWRATAPLRRLSFALRQRLRR